MQASEICNIGQFVNGPKLFESARFKDDRGFFEESFRADKLAELGIKDFVQENHSYSVSPTIRGMHYQLNPKAQGKLVRCISGQIYDVVVDLRKQHDTYGKWIGFTLTEHNAKSLYVPPGFAHGFFAYGKKPSHIIYSVTEYYSKECDRCIRWDDPGLNINWGLSDDQRKRLLISEKDASAPFLKDADNNF